MRAPKIATWLGLCAASVAGGCDSSRGTAPAPEPDAASVLWMIDRPGVGSPALDAQTVYFADREHQVLAIDRATGSVRWRARSDDDALAVFSPPRVVVAGDLVLFGDEALYALGAATGERRWVFDGQVDGVPTMPGAQTFVSDGQRVYTGSNLGRAFAVEGATGALLWRSDVVTDVDGALSGFASTVRVVAVDAGVVYLLVQRLGLSTGEVYALDATTGAIRWSYALPSEAGWLSVFHDAVLVHEGVSAPVLVVASYAEGRLTALTADGSVRWTADLRPGSSPTNSDMGGLTASAGLVVVTSLAANAVVAYDADSGAERWRVTPGRQLTDPEITSDTRTVFALLAGGVLGAFDLRTGEQQWARSAPSGGFQSVPTIGGDALYIAGTAGLYAIRRP